MKNKFKPTAAEELAFEKVIDAINEAKKLGLRFYGKQGRLVAYNKHAEAYEQKHGFYKLLHTTGERQLPHLGSLVLSDSGADDYISYLPGDDPDNQ